MATTLDQRIKRMLRESNYKVPVNYRFERHDKCQAGPDEAWIGMSHDSTRKLKDGGIDKWSKGLALPFHTDYQYPGQHGRMQRVNGLEGIYWWANLVVIDVQWLPKNRANLFCVDTGGDYVLILGYDYAHGKGDVVTYKEDYSLGHTFRDGYPPELAIVPGQELSVCFEEDVQIVNLAQALVDMGYRLATVSHSLVGPRYPGLHGNIGMVRILGGKMHLVRFDEELNEAVPIPDEVLSIEAGTPIRVVKL